MDDTSDERSSSTASSLGSATDVTSHHSVTEPVRLPNGTATSLGEASEARRWVAHDDLARRPALQLAAARLIIADVASSLSRRSPTSSLEYLACAGSILKTVLGTVELLLQGKLALPSEALLTCDEMLAAALSLRNDMHHVATECEAPDMALCEWERQIPGRKSSDPTAKKTGVAWKGDAEPNMTPPCPTINIPRASHPRTTGGTAGTAERSMTGDGADVVPTCGRVLEVSEAVAVVFQRLQKEQDIEIPSSTVIHDADNTAADVVSDRVCYSPPLPRPLQQAADEASIMKILPSGLRQGPVVSGRVYVQELKKILFDWTQLGADLPVFFHVEDWDILVWKCSKVNTAAQEVAAALKELSSFSPTALSAAPQTPHPLSEETGQNELAVSQKESPSELHQREMVEQWLAKMTSAKLDEQQAMEACMQQLQTNLDAARVARLIAKVNAAKNKYCDALIYVIEFPPPLAGLLHVVFSRCGATQSALKHPEAHASGSCPLRAQLEMTLASAVGALPPTPPAPCYSGNDPDDLLRAQMHIDKLSAMVCFVDGTCPRCDSIGKCRWYRGVYSCEGLAFPVSEKKAYIIPRAAACCAQLPLLLTKIDAAPPDEPPVDFAGLLEYLASPRNVFYLSSCLKSFFDSGALVFVKIGPPEFQFYRVTTTPKAVSAFINSDLDPQMRELCSHFGSTTSCVHLSCMNGLIVDLARPAKVEFSVEGRGLVLDHHEVDGTRTATHLEHAAHVMRPRNGSARTQVRDVARVSHRYLDLHARAHHLDQRRAPLVSHKYSLPQCVVDGLPNACMHQRCPPSAEGLSVEAWLDALEVDA